MKVLVTGGTGFFGTGILSALLEGGHDVVAAARGISPGARSIVLDVTSPQSCADAVAVSRPDVIVHAAALAHVAQGRVSPLACERVNVTGTANMLDAARAAGVRRFIFISSVLVYGETDLHTPVRETDKLAGADVYARTKMAAERECEARGGPIEIVILRMASMYGPAWLLNVRRRARPVPALPVALLIAPDERRFSLCSLRNGVSAVRAAVEGRLIPGIYNVADRYAYSQREILAAVRRGEGPLASVRLPRALATLASAAIWLIPSIRVRTRAAALYWKFCRPNIFSTDELSRSIVDLRPDLISSEPQP